MAPTVAMHGYVDVADFKRSHVFVNILPVINQQVIFIQGNSNLLDFRCCLLTALHPCVANAGLIGVILKIGWKYAIGGYSEHL